MDITPRIVSGSKIIQSYSNGKFRISGQVYEGAVIVTPALVLPWGEPAISESAIASYLSRLSEVEVVLLGVGAQLTAMPPFVREARARLGVPVDIMDTGAACRTYNVLLTEGRNVAAFMLPT